MALNKGLLTCIRTAEAQYGHIDNWPVSVLSHVRNLANRKPEENAERKEAEWLFRRGFTVNAVAQNMRRSVGWALARKPVVTTYEYTDDDLKELRGYADKSAARAAQIMRRNQLWVRRVREWL